MTKFAISQQLKLLGQVMVIMLFEHGILSSNLSSLGLSFKKLKIVHIGPYLKGVWAFMSKGVLEYKLSDKIHHFIIIYAFGTSFSLSKSSSFNSVSGLVSLC